MLRSHCYRSRPRSSTPHAAISSPIVSHLQQCTLFTSEATRRKKVGVEIEEKVWHLLEKACICAKMVGEKEEGGGSERERKDNGRGGLEWRVRVHVMVVNIG